ncbi:MAG: YicC/YloC family endoribonuclease [Thermoanaerobaculia bacterium]|nr:YicC/YloC family endoribonuclease [Thermoanaerobaculia bacterium]
MRSMTGFGEATGESDSRRLTVVVRGVNHRYLDVAARIPDLCRSSEAALQRLLGGRLERGRVELAVEVESLGPAGSRVELRSETARALIEALSELRSAAGIGGEVAIGDLLQVPGIVEVRALEQDWTEEDERLLLEVAAEALEQMMAARRSEGRRLAAVIDEKLEQLGSLAEALDALRPQAQQALSESFERRVDELMDDAELEAGRLEQEIALLIDRSNVSEELERLAAHLEHFGQIAEQSGAVGKRLDFVVQEIFRELNTLSAKCRSSAMSRRAVEAKVLCEELREQLRNVE